MKPRTIIVSFKKSTKGTHVYENQDVAISWYMPKAMFDGQPPDKISVTLEAVAASKKSSKKSAAVEAQVAEY